MIDLLKLGIVLSAIVLLLRRRFKIGPVLLMASGLLATLYLTPPARLAASIGKTLLEGTTVNLALSLTLIRVLELVLRENNILADMTEAARGLFRNRKLVIISMPMLIGMLPSLGGAYFSAPMVAESTKDLQISREEKGFINFWFRHPWEYILPLYPGVLLASALSGIELRTLIVANLPYTFVMIAAGFILSMRGIKGEEGPRRITPRGLASFIPLALVLLMAMALGIELHITLIVLLAGLFLFYRYPLRRILAGLRYGFALEVLLLVAGVMIFKGLMEETGAVRNLGEFFIARSLPLAPLLFILPFVSGFLTGLTVAAVGSTFPLILYMTGGTEIWAVSLAFAGGYMGVLLSPVHVCLIVTREYFHADLMGIYRRIARGCAVILCAVVIQYLLLRP